MNFGPTIRKIRIAKNMSQETLSKGIMNRSNLSRFENNHYSPAYHVIPKLLERLNMDYEEFLFLANSYHLPEVDNLNIKIMRAINTYDKKTLVALNKKAFQYTQISDNIQYRHLYLLSLSFLKKYFAINEHEVAIDELIHTEILDYFTKADNWYIYEFRLLNNFLHYFNLETILYLLPIAEKQLIKYTQTQNADSIHQHLWYNVGVYFFENKHYKNALHFFEKAISLSSTKRFLFEKIENTLYQQLCQSILFGEPLNIEEHLSVLKQFDFDNSVRYFKKIINDIY